MPFGCTTIQKCTHARRQGLSHYRNIGPTIGDQYTLDAQPQPMWWWLKLLGIWNELFFHFFFLAVPSIRSAGHRSGYYSSIYHFSIYTWLYDTHCACVWEYIGVWVYVCICVFWVKPKICYMHACTVQYINGSKWPWCARTAMWWRLLRACSENNQKTPEVATTPREWVYWGNCHYINPHYMLCTTDFRILTLWS